MSWFSPKTTSSAVCEAPASGDAIVVGTPLIKGAKVTGSVVRQGKAPKILVFRYKPKKRVRKLIGHRQRFAEVKIEKISLP